MIERIFDEKNGLLRIYWDGTVTIKEVLENARWIASNEKLPRKLKMITNWEKARPDISLEDGKALIEETANFIGGFEQIICASINPNSDVIMVGIRFEQLIKSQLTKGLENLNYKVFSNEKSAKVWLSKF